MIEEYSFTRDESLSLAFNNNAQMNEFLNDVESEKCMQWNSQAFDYEKTGNQETVSSPNFHNPSLKNTLTVTDPTGVCDTNYAETEKVGDFLSQKTESSELFYKNTFEKSENAVLDDVEHISPDSSWLPPTTMEKQAADEPLDTTLSSLIEWQKNYEAVLQKRRDEELRLKEELQTTAQKQLAEWYEESRKRIAKAAAENSAVLEKSETHTVSPQNTGSVKQLDWKRVWELVTERSTSENALGVFPRHGNTISKREEPLKNGTRAGVSASRKTTQRDTSRLMQLLDELRQES